MTGLAVRFSAIIDTPAQLGGAGHDAGKWQHGNEGAPAGSPLGRGGLGGRRSRARDQQGIHPSLM